ncbi:unnamed protein product [Aureobasidium mustum]|uniref:Uncharacterized protein n=1 Tax=Aureobasidium mustum TaxID=2773714 RepID=A0A9N8JJS3_9PEZI|nr:unnamed protein product [Aureobasidium mustum]
MPFVQFTLPSDNQHDIDPAWFDKQKQRFVEKNNPTLRNWLIEQVDALKAFHDGDLSADAAAAIMRHPISTSSVPDLGSYSDEAKGVDEAELALARRLYLRIRDLEAQLIAKRVIGLGMRRNQYIILALEKNIDDSDRQIATNEATAYEQVKLDFHIPAISFLFKHDARDIYDRVVRDELRDWAPAQLLPESAGLSGNDDWMSWLKGRKVVM